MIPIASAPGPAGGSTRADGWDRIRAIEIHPGSGPRTHDPNRPIGVMTGSGENLADRSGRSVGPYRLDALLGRGGMGAVYAARDARLGRRVAVKHVPADADAARRQRFRREAAALARLSHPAIVRIFDLVEAADGDWIVMELVEGPTLAQLVAGGPLPVTRAVAIGRQVAEGLAEAHAQGILHRDLKTENVMLDLRGPSTAHGGGAADRAMILDFGLAKSLGGEEWETPLSVSGQILGTYRAMSPEQVRGLPLDPRSDLFSLGVLLYEITTGERPFRGDTPLETLNQVTRHPHLAARARRPEVPARLSELIDRLLEKSPEMRPASAGEVADALAELAPAERPAEVDAVAGPAIPEESTITSTAPGVLEPASGSGSDGPSVRRRRGLLALAAGALAAAVMVAVLARDTWTRWLSPSSRVAVDAAGEADAATLLRLGMTHLDRFDKPGRLEQAVAAFEALLANDERSAPAHAGLALVYWRQYVLGRDPLRLEQAAAVARRAVELDGDLVLGRVALGIVDAESGRYEQAIRGLEAALALEPANARAHGGLARVYEVQGRIDDALAAAARAVELDPGDRALRDQLGMLYFRAARYAEAEAEFRRSVELAPDGAYGYRNLSAVCYMQGRLAEAEAAIRKALAIQPEHSLYSNLGTLLYAQGLYVPAVRAFEQALRLGGGNYYLYWANLADAHRFTAGHEAAAKEAYGHAIELLRGELAAKPESALLRSRLGLYLAKRGDCGAALAEIAAPGERKAEDLYRTAVAYEVCGERGRALPALAAALRAGFPRREVQEDPELFGLRSDPRYRRLVAELGSPTGETDQPPVPPSPTTISGPALIPVLTLIAITSLRSS